MGAALACTGVYNVYNVYKPRRSRASALFRLVETHFPELHTVYDERFAETYGAWRPVIRTVTERFLACGILEHGFARVRCGSCAHEYLLAFSCKCRYFCPSCHAKRLAVWGLWLEDTLLAPVPHRQVVLTIPKRLRAYCLYRRSLLGEIARVAARTITAAIRVTSGERALSVGIIGCLQTHGSRANWHPHIHMIVTDGGFRADAAGRLRAGTEDAATPARPPDGRARSPTPPPDPASTRPAKGGAYISTPATAIDFPIPRGCRS
jgi:hypothetical protein